MGEVKDVPPSVLSTPTASHGLVLSVPVLRYHATKIACGFAATVTGQELSRPAIPIARGVLHVPPPVDIEKYS